MSTPPAFDVPVRRVPVRIVSNVWRSKTRMVWLPDGKKLKICLFILTKYTNVTDAETDGRTHGQTNTARRREPRLRIPSRAEKKT